MKKTALLILGMAFMASAASAATVKDLRTDVRNFWGREAKRSGISDSTSSWDKFLTNVNPVNFFKSQQDAYNARKVAAPVK